MTQNTEVPKACDVIPLLEQEWQQNPVATREKFLQFIEYHKAQDHRVVTCLYRSALVQLQSGYNTQTLNGLGMNDQQLQKAAGA